MSSTFPPSLLALIDEATPKINPDIGNGLPVKHCQQLEDYVHQVFLSAAEGFPPGLTYHGFRRLTPAEEYAETTRKRSARASYDVARSDVYLVAYLFRYLDQPLPEKLVYLPYLTQYNEIYLGGSRFMVSAVLADRVISTTANGIFVRLLKAKLNFNRLPYHIVVDSTRITVQIPYGDIYNEKKEKGARVGVRASCTLAHYLFCKYGFEQAMQRYAGFTPIVMKESDGQLSQYANSQFKIVTSCKLRPRGFGSRVYDRPSDLAVIVPAQYWNTLTESLLTGFFYVVDHFPHRFEPSYVNHPRLWMVLLGYLIWGSNISEGKLGSDIEDHIRSLDEYIDAIVAAKLKEIGFPCKTIYDLFAVVCNHYNEWVLAGNSSMSSVWNKELVVLYYLCYDLISSIHKLYFKLRAAMKKPLDARKVQTIVNLNLRTGVIHGLRSGHGELSTVSTSGDNRVLKASLMIVRQEGSGGKRGRGRQVLTDPTMHAHISIVEHAGFANLPKSNPDGSARVNPMTMMNSSGLLLRNPDNAELLDAAQLQLNRSQ